MDYVSPIDPRAAEPVAPAPREGSLAGRRVALLDISKARGEEFLDRVEGLVRERGGHVERFAKPLFSRPAPAEVIRAVAIRADLAVEGLGD